MKRKSLILAAALVVAAIAGGAIAAMASDSAPAATTSGSQVVLVAQGTSEPADDADENIGNIVYEHHERHDYAGNELGFPTCFIQPLVDSVKFRNRFFLTPEGFDNLMPPVHLLDMAVYLAEGLLLSGEITLRSLEDRAQE